MSISQIFSDANKNKQFLSSFAQILLAVSLIGCILAIIDYHGDLAVGNDLKGTNSTAFGDFCLVFNIFVIIGNLTYVVMSIHRFSKFTKDENEEVLKDSFRSSFRDLTPSIINKNKIVPMN